MRPFEACSRVPFLIALLCVAACGGEPDDQDLEDDALAEASDEVLGYNALTPNALTPNALTPNALTPNALTPNALTPNALTPNALTPNALSAIQDPAQVGSLARQLLRYTVGCALTPAQSFSFSWTDAAGAVHAETYKGELGLAPIWALGPLDTVGQEWVSACLAARTNWYGVSVTLSARGPHAALNDIDVTEFSTYDVEEGTFFGNVFSASPALYACYKSTDVAYARARQRDCSAGHLEADGTVSKCGIINIVGSCDDVCSKLKTVGQYRPYCTNGGSYASTRPITVFLD